MLGFMHSGEINEKHIVSYISVSLSLALKWIILLLVLVTSALP